ncbi:MAG: hypothetical protein KJP04_03415, partial [Arenicella sp.]|nr:hypothetical protein [Arenicella sp.]
FGVLAAILLITGISGERAPRNMQHTIERSLSESGLPGAFKDLENLDEMSAEETGEAVGKFLKGLEKAAREMEQEEAENKSD